MTEIKILVGTIDEQLERIREIRASEKNGQFKCQEKQLEFDVRCGGCGFRTGNVKKDFKILRSGFKKVSFA